MLFFYLSAVEKVFKSYLKIVVNDDKLFFKISHDIQKGWMEVIKHIKLKSNFDSIYFNSIVTELHKLYEQDLRYVQRNYDLNKAIKANNLMLEIISYFLNNTEHNILPLDYFDDM